MNSQQFHARIHELFGQLLTDFKENEEYGSCNFSSADYRKIGYATNITPEIVLQACLELLNGVRALVKKIQEKFQSVEAIQLIEEHDEVI